MFQRGGADIKGKDHRRAGQQVATALVDGTSRLP